MDLTQSEILSLLKTNDVYPYKHLIFWSDLIIVPVILFLIHLFLKNKKKQQPELLQKYFYPGYYIRILGIIIFMIHHTFIYKGGVDCFTYYWATNEISNLFLINPSKALYILFTYYKNIELSNFTYTFIPYTFTAQESLVIKTSTVCGFFCGNSFLGINLILGLFAFSGCWRLYKTIFCFYPELYKPMALTFLFIPSVFFWSSVISKEIICLGAMGFLCHSFLQVFYFRVKIIINFLILILMSYILYRVKIYILMSLAPALLILLCMLILQNIKSKFLKIFSLPILMLALSFILFLIFNSIQGQLERFAFDSILENAAIIYNYLSTDMAESRYDLGVFEPTPNGLLKMIPSGIMVTMFRPYFWEINKPIVLIASLESMLTFFLTIFVILKVGLFTFFGRLFTNPIAMPFIIFSVFFAISVGVTSGNFGTLMRYKIPLLPFYYTALAIIYYNPVLRVKQTV